MGSMQLKDIVRIQTASINPMDAPDKLFHLYSLPSFDENQKREEVYGHQIQSNKSIVPNKCILFNKLNVRFQRIWLIDNKDKDKICSTEFLPLIVNEDKVDFYYCYFLLHSPGITNYLTGQNTNTSGSHKRIDPDDFLSIEVHLPSISDQKRIGKFLYDIEQKITVNRQINDYLAAMARQLYDYWFVQFDFPDENGRPYKSSGGNMVWNDKLKRDIPEGWEAVSVFEGASVLYGFPFSTESFVEKPTDKPLVRIRDILERSVSAYTTEVVDEKYRLNKGDVVIGMDGNFHMNIWQDDNAFLNQRCVRIRSKANTTVSSIQILYDAKPYIEAREKTIKGSTVGHLSDKDMKLLQILVAKRNKYFNPRPVFDTIVDEISENRLEISNLTKQRDNLLPLLMNGQVSVKQLNNHL